MCGVHICNWCCYRISLHLTLPTHALTLDNTIPDSSSGFLLLNIFRIYPDCIFSGNWIDQFIHPCDSQNSCLCFICQFHFLKIFWSSCMNIEQMFVSFCFVSFVLHTGGGVKHITFEARRTQMYLKIFFVYRRRYWSHELNFILVVFFGVYGLKRLIVDYIVYVLRRAQLSEYVQYKLNCT